MIFFFFELEFGHGAIFFSKDDQTITFKNFLEAKQNLRKQANKTKVIGPITRIKYDAYCFTPKKKKKHRDIMEDFSTLYTQINM